MNIRPDHSASVRILELDLTDALREIVSGKNLPIEKKITAPTAGSMCEGIFKEIAGRADANVPELFGAHTRTIFTSGEHKIKYDATVAGRQVFIILRFPVLDETASSREAFQLASALLTNNYLFLAIEAADAARRAGASEIHLLMPNYAYARQDKTHKERGPITAAVTAKLLEDYYDTITSLHLHSPAIEGMVEPGKLTNISPNEIFASHVVCRDPETFAPIAPEDLTVEGVTALFNKLCIASPDVGGTANARDFAKYCKHFATALLNVPKDSLPDIPMAVIDKRRPAPNVSEVMNVLGKENVVGRKTIIIDDMLDTAGTSINAAAAYKEAGAADVEFIATHGYFLGRALDNLTNSVISKVTVTDSMALRPAVLAHPKVNVISIAPALTQIIADMTTQPEPNLRFHNRHVGDADRRATLGRYVAAMLPSRAP